MRYFALAADYDGTLAKDGFVSEETVEALKGLRASERKLILVTGRLLSDLKAIFPALELFDLVVAENGALLYRPQNGEEKVLSEPAPAKLYELLESRGVRPLERGKVIVATHTPYEGVVLEAIRELSLESQVIFNKGSVMVLPAGVNKASGLSHALNELNLCPQNVIGIGDAENDHSFLELCACGVAVSNALPAVKDRATIVTAASHGAGVIELINRILENDLRDLELKLPRGRLVLGKDVNGKEVYGSAFGTNILVAGSSGAGKSTFATGFLERLGSQGYQFCIIDPEGDYEAFEHAVSLGSANHAPEPQEVMQVLEHPGKNAAVNMISIPFSDRPRAFLSLFSRLQELRARTGRPHWIIIDEAHHVLPVTSETAAHVVPEVFSRTLFVTLRPKELLVPGVRSVSHFVGVGEHGNDALNEFLTLIGERVDGEIPAIEQGRVLLWERKEPKNIRTLEVIPAQQMLKRHRRKYAEGALPPDRSFYFTGEDARLNLRAPNLIVFTQLAEGIDDDTWTYHLKRHEYSKWFREAIKDEPLSLQALTVENADMPAAESKVMIKSMIDEIYTLPADSAAPKSAPD